MHIHTASEGKGDNAKKNNKNIEFYPIKFHSITYKIYDVILCLILTRFKVAFVLQCIICKSCSFIGNKPWEGKQLG